MSVMGTKEPRGMNSTVVPMASPTARPRSDPRARFRRSSNFEVLVVKLFLDKRSGNIRTRIHLVTLFCDRNTYPIPPEFAFPQVKVFLGLVLHRFDFKFHR